MWRTRPVCIHSPRLPALISSRHNNATDCCLPAVRQARAHFFSRALPPAVTVASGLATSLWRARKDKGLQVAKWRKGSLMRKRRAGRGGKKSVGGKKVTQIVSGRYEQQIGPAWEHRGLAEMRVGCFSKVCFSVVQLIFAGDGSGRRVHFLPSLSWNSTWRVPQFTKNSYCQKSS